MRRVHQTQADLAEKAAELDAATAALGDLEAARALGDQVDQATLKAARERVEAARTAGAALLGIGARLKSALQGWRDAVGAVNKAQAQAVGEEEQAALTEATDLKKALDAATARVQDLGLRRQRHTDARTSALHSSDEQALTRALKAAAEAEKSGG